jgi:uncharacterized membrane protein (UPF0127 family)
MLLVFDPKDIPSLWPKGMKFPIDIIWIDGTTVVGVDKGAEPEGNLALEGIKLYSPRQLVDKVLQINAGLADKLNIDSGSKIELNIKK